MNAWVQKRKILQRYNLTARIYDLRYSEEQAAKYQSALSQLKIPFNSTILDVGCGTGLFFRHIATKVETAVAIDISKELLLKAKDRARLFKNIFLVQSDADYMPLKDKYFDIIFAFTVLQNTPKPLKTINEIKNCAKCRSLIVVTGLKKAFSKKEFIDLLQNARLKIITLEDADELKGYIAVTVQK